jgi:hypothetical protein
MPGRRRLPREKPAKKSAGKNNQLRIATRLLGVADSLHLKKVLRKGKKLQGQPVMLSDSRQGYMIRQCYRRLFQLLTVIMNGV